MTFSAVWNELQSRLKPGTEILGWGAVRGYTGMRFKITDISHGSITVASSTMSMPRTISKQEFEKLYDAWDAYCARRLDRQQVTNISQNSSYIFSIFRWMADSR